MKRQIPAFFFTTALAGAILTHPSRGERLLIERNARPLLAEGTLEALAPWETPIEGFFVRSHHNVLPAQVDDSWQVSFEGLLSRPRKISVRELKKRKAVSFHAVLECSGNGRALFTPAVSGIQWKRGAVGNAEWTGVRLADVIRDLGVKSGAEYVTVEGFDEPVMKNDKNDAKFVRSIPLRLLNETGAILAWNMNRVPVPVAHGGPVRLVMPGIYGQNWIKWVTKMTFAKDPDPRMYAKKAYRMPDKPVKPGEAWDPVKNGKPVEYIKVQTIFTSPGPGAKIMPGKVVLRGKAFSGTGPVEKVEVSTDAGNSWKPANLRAPKLAATEPYATEPYASASWQEFEFETEVREGRSMEAWARATDARGNVQPVEQEWNPKGYLYNAVDRVRFTGDAAGAALAGGAALAAEHCQTCHSLGIAEGQRLSKSEWVKTVKKMSDYGLVVADADAEKIAGYFAEKYPPGTPVDDSREVELAADPSSFAAPWSGVTSGGVTSGGVTRRANAASGGKLFATHCASCHGSRGEGRIGPVLRGRSLTDATFWSTAMNGRRTMPAFKETLTTRQMADVREWLRSEKSK